MKQILTSLFLLANISQVQAQNKLSAFVKLFESNITAGNFANNSEEDKAMMIKDGEMASEHTKLKANHDKMMQEHQSHRLSLFNQPPFVGFSVG